MIFKNKCVLGTVVSYSMKAQMLGSSTEAQLIYLIMRLSAAFEFWIIFICYWFGSTHITLLYLNFSKSLSVVKLPDPAKAPSKHLWHVCLASYRAWVGDCGPLSTVSFTVGSWCVFWKSGQEGIRITNTNKWLNGLFGGKSNSRAINPLNWVQFTVPKVVTQSSQFFSFMLMPLL